MTLSAKTQEYNTYLGENYKGQPKMPKSIVESRLVKLQEESAQLDSGSENYADRIATLNREIEESQEMLNNQGYTEDPVEIEYWVSYNQGLHQYIIDTATPVQPE